MALGKKKKSPAKAKKKGFLDTIGIKTDAVPTQEEEKSNELDEKIVLAWKYLRSRIDVATHEYYRTGKFNKVEEFVERPALDAIKSELHRLRTESIYWSQQDRPSVTEPVFRVISKELNKKGQPTKFVIQERFKDFSSFQKVEGGSLTPDSRCPGVERVIQATVSVRNGSDYKLHSVIRVEHATI